MIFKLMAGIAILICCGLFVLLIGPFFLFGETVEWWRTERSVQTEKSQPAAAEPVKLVVNQS